MWIVPAIAWAAIIAYVSSLPSETMPTGILAFPHADKVLHMAEYFVFGVWLLIAFVRWGEENLAQYAPHLSVAVGAVYAVTDEVHQAFVPGRSGSIEDVLADLAGLVLAVVMLRLLIGRSSEELTSTPPSSKD